MKYKNGVWHCDDPVELSEFFSHRDDGRMLPQEPEPVYPPDHTDPIWDRRFKVILPIIAVKSVETLSRKGLVLTGIKKVDNAAHERLIYPYLSIAEMIDVEDNGYKITYTSYDDLITIYHLVKDYIGFWQKIINKQEKDVHNFVDYPSDDIARLESYMHSIYPLIKKSVSKPEHTWTNMLGRFMLMGSDTPPKPKLQEQPDLNQGLPDTLGEF